MLSFRNAPSFRAPLTACCMAASMITARANGVRVVDDPALPTFTSLQAAIDAAPEGSLLLVQSGTYAASTIDGKSLSIVKVPGAVVVIPSLHVNNLTSLQHVLLSGLIVQNPLHNQPAVQLQNDTGAVRIQDCTITAGYVTSAGGAGLDVQAATQVVLTNCTVRGGDGSAGESIALPGGPGISSQNSNLALYDCVVRGGHGSPETQPSGGDGGDACHVTGWGLYASGCTFRGGSGGYGDWSGCNAGGLGGDGIDETNAQVIYIDCQFSAGLGGTDSCSGLQAPGGLLIRSTGGLVTAIAGARRKLAGTSVSADDASLTLTITGQPGDRFYLARSWSPIFAYQPAWHGVWTVSSVASGFARAIVPPGGVLTLQVRAQDVVGLDHRLELLQGFGIDANGFQFLTGPVHVEYLDALGGPDCDSSSTNDFIQLIGGAADCNGNVALDACDIGSGTSQDVNQNGIPDECPGG
jgi:hypothetical protein